MKNLTKLSENLNLNLNFKILNSAETTSLKGGLQANLKLDDISKLPIPKPGAGAGLPPTLDS